MLAQITERPGRSFLVLAASFVIVIAGMKAATSILVPLLIAAFLAIVCDQPVEWLHRVRVPRPLALLIVIAAVTLIIAVSMAFVGASVGRLIAELPKYETKIEAQKAGFVEWMQGHNITGITEEDLTFFDPGTGIRLFGAILSSLSSLLSNAFMILLLLAFLLVEISVFPKKLERIIGADARRQTENVVTSVRQYVGMKMVISLATGAIITLWLRLLNVDYPFLWGTIAFLLNFIPNVGSLMAAIPAVGFVLLEQDFTQALWAGLAYVVVNIVLGSIVEPRVLGEGLGLSGIVVLVSLVFWGWVLGPIGMLLAVPLTMTAKIVFEASEETRWLAELMGPEPIK
jgi:AI-2 transport protein TqsA